MIRTSPGALPRLLAVLAAVLLAAPVTPAAARPSAPTVTWAVQPANQHGPDGRRWIEHTLDPGQVVTEHLAVRNFSDAPVLFSLKAADGYLTDKGRFNMLASGETSVDGGTWITVREQVAVAAGETRVVPFTITVPGDATPGDHPAGIAATVTSTGGTVAVESRVGFRVMMRASGTVTPAVSIDDLTATYRSSWNPFGGGSVQVDFATTNTGNVTVAGIGRVTVTELFGLTSRNTRAEVEEMLPGGSRQVSGRVTGVWGLGPVRTTVEVTPAVLGGQPTDAEIRTAAFTVTTWAVPWAQLALAAALITLGLAYRLVVRRRRRRLARLLARARSEGREEARTAALAGGPPSAP